jgi:hypothetical protein
MKNHRTGKLVAGVIAAVTVLSLMSLPAAANTVAVNTTGGNVTLINPGGGVVGNIPLPALPMCTNPASTVTTVGNINFGTFTATLQYHRPVNIGGVNFIVILSIGLTGTYGVAPPNYAINGTGSATAIFVRSTGMGSCIPLAGFGNCVMNAANIMWNGNLNAANAAVLGVGDNGNVNGANVAPNTTVVGGAANCGPLLALNNGSITLNGVGFFV